MPYENLPIGDTVPATTVLAEIDSTIQDRFDRDAVSVEFTVGGGSRALSRAEVEDWVIGACADGYSMVRYIIRPKANAIIAVDLAALRDSVG